ncbi:uncharacterized protein C11orf91 homolog isoform X1 [Lates japonicus]
MRFLGKMAAAVRFFPSIHDNTTDNNEIWAPFDPKLNQPNTLKNTSAADSSKKDFGDGDDQNSSTSQMEAEAPAAWMTSGCLRVPDYQPLDAFSATAPEDPGPAPWSEEEEICELLIRMKELELLRMMGEPPGILQYTFVRNIKYCRMKQTRRKQK